MSAPKTAAVTNEMIEAGLYVLDLDPIIRDDAVLVRMIYQAMRALEQKAAKR